MYQKTIFAVIVALCFLGAQASYAVEDGTALTPGDTWAFGKEIDLMQEASSEIDELEGNITELMSSEDADRLKNYTGLELKEFNLDNEAVLGFFYTGEVVDNFDQMVHIKTEQSLYSHTVLGTQFTSMLPPAGQHEVVLYAKCNGEVDEEDECENEEDLEVKLLDNKTGESLVLSEVNTVLGGSMHYIAKITEETWWTEDTHELVKTKITLALGASGDITIKNVPNLTVDGVAMTELLSDDDEDEGEDEGEESGLFEDCDENEEEKSASCHELIDVAYETAVFSMKADASMSLMFDFGDKPMNVMDLPLDENKYWEGELDRLTISGDIGGKLEVEKPQLSICPDLDCDNLPEMKELYSGITDALQELHDNETMSITVDRDGDGLPDVITEWNDLFPVYIPETWMDDVLQEIVDGAFCEDEESAQEGEECDETAEEEYEKLNLRIENNRFTFGPYNLHDIEDFEPLPYSFETGDKETVKGSDGETYEGYQVLPTTSCSEKNPNRNDDDCDREDGEEDDEGDDDDRDDDEDDFIPDGGARSGHDGEDHSEGCEEGDIFCDSDIIWFHDADTGRPAYINMDMPNLREEGYSLEMTPISHSEAQDKVEQNADPQNPEKTELIEFDSSEVIEDSDELPGFGIMAAGASLLFVSRRFRK